MRSRLIFVLAIAALLASCAREADQAAPPQASTPPREAPTDAELRNATYLGIPNENSIARLDQGEYEMRETDGTLVWQMSYNGTLPVEGDFTGDGSPDAIATLVGGGGGSGMFEYLALMVRDETGVRQAGLVLLGDRISMRDVRNENGQLAVDVVEQGPDDPMCCPGQLATYRWAMKGGKWQEVAHEVTGRLSVSGLSGTTWVLQGCNDNTIALNATPITLSFEGGRLRGNAGCNDYQGEVTDTEGGTPGSITVERLASTRRACDDPEVMKNESRFIALLDQADSFQIEISMLLVHCRVPEGLTTLTFALVPKVKL
jgi:heat shock protein HslJ